MGDFGKIQESLITPIRKDYTDSRYVEVIENLCNQSRELEGLHRGITSIFFAFPFPAGICSLTDVPPQKDA